MKTKKLLLLISLTFLAAGCDSSSPSSESSQNLSISASGQERGNGTDYFTSDEQSAWFADPTRAFSYCIEVSPDFGVSADLVPEIVSSAITEWENYILDRSPNFAGKLLTLKANLQATCTPSTDLKLYFGVNNPLTKPYASNSKRLGVAVRTSFDANAGWGQGFIWLTKQASVQPDPLLKPSPNLIFPDWSARVTLHAVLLHELGHVFGNGHIADTIMDAELAEYVLYYFDPYNSAHRIAGIDGVQQLLDQHMPFNGTLGLSPVIDVKFSQTCVGDINANFQLLTGKAPTGAVSAQLSYSGDTDLILNVSDEKGSHTISIRSAGLDSPGYSISPYTIAGVFKIVKKDITDLGSEELRDTSARSVQITTETGQVLFGTYEHNLYSMFSIGTATDKTWQTYTATGQVLTYFTAAGPRYLFVSSVHQSGGMEFQGDIPRRSCP